jgi:hypothetical protein
VHLDRSSRTHLQEDEQPGLRFQLESSYLIVLFVFIVTLQPVVLLLADFVESVEHWHFVVLVFLHFFLS